MGAFDQPDGADVPNVIREFHVAKQRLVAHSGSLGKTPDAIEAALAFGEAQLALAAWLSERGGRYQTPKLIYVHKPPGAGVTIEQTAPPRSGAVTEHVEPVSSEP